MAVIVHQAVAVRAAEDWKELTDMLNDGWTIYWSDGDSSIGKWAFILCRDEVKNG